MERTFSFVKPDGVKKNIIGEVLKRYEASGLKIIGLKMVQLSRKQAEGFYAVHSERSFFKDLVEFMTSGPVVAIALEGDQAIEKVRQVNGATDFTKAEKGTIRADFATSIQNNIVHGSDGADTCKFEMAYIFNAFELQG